MKLDGVTVEVRDVDGRQLGAVDRGSELIVWRCALCRANGEDATTRRVAELVGDLIDHLIGEH